MPNLPPKESETESSTIGFFNGQWITRDQISISIADLGFRQAVTAVERLRTYGGNVFQLNSHLRRFRQSTSALLIDGMPPEDTIARHIEELLQRNQSTVDQWHDTGITLFATPGVCVGGPPTFAIHLNPLDFELFSRRRTHGQPLVVTDIQQPPAESWPRSIKVRCRLHYFLADQIAAESSPYAAGVLIDHDGTITETSICNVAIVISGAIVSPPPQRILGGITQSIVEQIAKAKQIPWQQQPITVGQLKQADEVLLMGTGAGLWFANRVDDRVIHKGQPGPVYQQLLAGFDEFTDQTG